MQEHIKHIEAEIIDQFHQDDNNRPWIIGFSGGKDSTMLLQLVWNALKKIDPIIRAQRRVYVICNDTLVENPKIVDFIYRTLKNIEKAAVRDGLNLLVETLKEDLGVLLSGRAFCSNLFVRSSQKGFSLQSLTQKAA